MSPVLLFPTRKSAVRPMRGTPRADTWRPGHDLRGGPVISWVRPSSCACCGRPTLRGGGALCSRCDPPSVA